MNAIKDNNSISRKELSEIIGIAQSSIQKHMNTLKTKKLIERVGPAKGGYWKVMK
ncbi:winged helix-turn-helix transcriptional regulator [Pseudopedobacter sp.]|uniref:winged helix-turn-helix transcriptional regulator n=1 Tax=Pseudopedobacter sp. TaxID=1936787 RepID=UPI0033417371